MNHFVVIIPACTPPLQDQLTILFRDRGFAWWHWAAECWLLATDAVIDAVGVRSIILEVIIDPQIALMVLRVDMPQTGSNWATLGSNLDAMNWDTWLQQYWENPSWRPS